MGKLKVKGRWGEGGREEGEGGWELTHSVPSTHIYVPAHLPACTSEKRSLTASIFNRSFESFDVS